jgi:hypothetical protein
VITVVESTDLERELTSITLDTVDNAMNEHLNVLTDIISDLKMNIDEALFKLQSTSLSQGTGLTKTTLQTDPT